MSKIIPFGDRILVKRRIVGDKLGKEGLIIAVETTAERQTDLADVIYVSDHSFCDKHLIDNSESIVASLTKEAKEGNAEALKAVINFNEYLKRKSVQPGDRVMISQYVGVTFHDNQGGGNLTLVSTSDIIGVVDE